MTLLERCIHLPVEELAQYPSDQLMELKLQAIEAVTSAKSNLSRVDLVLTRRYGEEATQRRLALAKDTGTVNILDGTVHVSVEQPKRIEWDQQKLKVIVDRIRQAGEDPTEFVEISYRVAEAKYNAWPASLRASFDSARTLKPGKPNFHLALRRPLPDSQIPTGGAR